MAWAIYSVVGYACWTVAPLAIGPLVMNRQLTVTAWRLGWSAVYFAASVAVGAILGGAAGAAVRQAAENGAGQPARWRQRVEAAATLTLLIPFVFSFAYPVSSGSLARWFLALCPVFALALIASLSSADAAGRLRPITNPWVVSAVLNGAFMISSYTTTSGNPLWVNLLIPAGFSILVAAGSFLLFRGTRLGWAGAAPGVGLRVLLCAGLGALGVAGSLILDAEPPSGTRSETNPTRWASGPSVVLIILDSVRADHLSLYGYQRDTTPYLKRLAAEATVYENAYSTSDTSIGSHASMFTGMYPSWHGAHYAPPEHPYGRSLDPEIPTLASILSERGYRTLLVAANNAYLSDGFGLTRGFQVRESRALLPLNWPEDFGRSFLRWVLGAFVDTSGTDRLFRRAEELNAQISGYLPPQAGRGPFLLAINYMDAHHPYLPPPPYDRRFPGKDRRYTYPTYQAAWHDINSQQRGITAEERRHLTSQYDGGIAYLDHQIGLLAGELKRMGLYEDTMFIVTSDHGEAFGEKGLLEHGVSVYQNLVRVPLLIKYPGQKEGLVVREAASGADLMPTVLARTGCSIPPNVQGRDLMGNSPGKLDFVLSESFPRTAAFVETRYPRLERTERAVISGNMKLIVSTAGKKELYDLAADPNEERNLYRADHPAVRELESKLKKALQTLPRHKAQPRRLDVERLRQLKSLGYIR